MEYLKLDPDIDTDPDLEEVGWGAARVYELLLKVSAKYDLRGRIPPDRQRPSWLAKRWNLTAEDLPGVQPEDFISGGLARLLKVGKLFREGDVLVIRGWDGFYGAPASGAERTRLWRAKERDRNGGDITSSPRDATSPQRHGDATPPDQTKTPPDQTPPPPCGLVGAVAVVGESEVTELWEWLQQAKRDVRPGAALDPRLPGFDGWAKRVLESTGPPGIDRAWVRYLEDQHFAKRGWPLAIFMQDAVWLPRTGEAQRKVRL